ncbi:MAG: N-acetylmuramoyl-L-alanine amidase [Muribaculaceae bacterium]|nr:N-acetylmuramoyl-L-alanine amidase [Muribaculaceae bacterium]
MKILIDNGHGAETRGKQSPDGKLREFSYTREIARRIAADRRLHPYSPELLVPESADIPLGQRCRRANAWCDRLGSANVLLVSIHLNAAGCGQWMRGRGWEAWTSPGKTNADTLAEALYQAAKELLPPGTPIRCDYTDGDSDKESRFTILTGTRCPAVLTENLFQDNQEESEYLMSEEGKAIITELHVRGIMNYIQHALKKL